MLILCTCNMLISFIIYRVSFKNSAGGGGQNGLKKKREGEWAMLVRGMPFIRGCESFVGDGKFLILGDLR